jgi:hypothetical protein
VLERRNVQPSLHSCCASPLTASSASLSLRDISAPIEQYIPPSLCHAAAVHCAHACNIIIHVISVEKSSTHTPPRNAMPLLRGLQLFFPPQHRYICSRRFTFPLHSSNSHIQEQVWPGATSSRTLARFVASADANYSSPGSMSP